MALEKGVCGGCGRSLAGEDVVTAAGVLLCLPCARESGWARRRMRVDPPAVVAAALFLGALALPWAEGPGMPGVAGLAHIKWLVGLSGLFLAALSRVRNERTSALFLFGPLALLGALALHWYTVERLRPGQEGPMASLGLEVALAGVVVLAWALWREPRQGAPPPGKG